MIIGYALVRDCPNELMDKECNYHCGEQRYSVRDSSPNQRRSDDEERQTPQNESDEELFH